MGDAVLSADFRREFWALKMNITPSLSLLFKKFSHSSFCTQHEKQFSPQPQPLRCCCCDETSREIDFSFLCKKRVDCESDTEKSAMKWKIQMSVHKGPREEKLYEVYISIMSS